MAVESIAKTLGTGSGIDVGALVGQLVQAQFENKTAQLTAKSETVATQISKVGELKSTLNDFSTALAALTNGGTLATQPTSSKSDVLTVTRLSGADLTGLSASMEVKQLAQAQVASTNAFTGGETTVVGTGTLTLTFGTATVSGTAMTAFTAGAAAPVSITIDSAHKTLAGVVEAINAANAGVTASILTDSTGSRLVVKGSTGASQAFQLKGSSQLTELDIGRNEPGSQINTAAQDSIVAIDGVQTKSPTNSLYGVIPGVRVDLVSAAVGTKVAIGASTPTTDLKQSITNFVDTYNEVLKMAQAAIDPKTGPLRGDPAAKDLVRRLKGLTLATLVPNAPAGTPRTLADMGVATQRNGTLTVDSARLATVATTYPKQLEGVFAQGSGVTAALNAIVTAATNKETGLGASEANYSKQQTKIEDAKDALSTQSDKMTTRLTQQFAAMDAKVAAYKSTQTFLTQQIAAWNASH